MQKHLKLCGKLCCVDVGFCPKTSPQQLVVRIRCPNIGITFNLFPSPPRCHHRSNRKIPWPRPVSVKFAGKIPFHKYTHDESAFWGALLHRERKINEVRKYSCCSTKGRPRRSFHYRLASHQRRGEEIGENDKCLHLPTISFWPQRKVQERLGCLLSGCFELFTSFTDFNIDEAKLLER